MLMALVKFKEKILFQVLNDGDATCFDQPEIVNVLGVAVSDIMSYVMTDC